MNNEFITELSKLLTKDNITFALSVFGSVGALYTFINSCLIMRKHLKITISDIAYNQTVESLVLSLAFENRSQLPIAVTSIQMKIGKTTIDSVKYPAFVGEYFHKHGQEVVDKIFEYNIKLPLDINQLSASSGCVLFDIAQEELENLSTPLTILIYSTRGRVQKIRLQPDQIKYLK